MRNATQVFHLAIPCANLDEAVYFYVNQLGCELARRYTDRITLNFFGDQVVCHLAPDKIDREVTMYPRHFGITFSEESEFERLYERACSNGAKLFSEKFIRFKGMKEQHLTFFLQDPSNNLLEFKYYSNSDMMY